MMKYLLGRGAQASVRDHDGRTALHLSTGAESSKCIKQLCKQLTADAVNEVDNESMTAAHWAAYHDHYKHLESLLEAGVSLALRDREGKLPLHWTAANPTIKTAQRILGAAPGCINDTDNEGRTVAHLAVAENNINLIHLLVPP